MLHDTQQDISAPIILCPIHNGECKFTGDEILKAYQEQQEQCASVWTPQQFYAPYTSLIQASESRGYPKRSIIVDVLTGQAFSEAHYLTFLSALFGVCSEFFDQQLRKNAENICGHIFISDKNDEIFELQTTFWNNVLESCYKNLMITLKNLSNPSSFKMLLALDEAGVLIDRKNSKGNFYHLQRALQAIPHGGDACFMALFTDILSRVSNFSPAKCHDPSTRLKFAIWDDLLLFGQMLIKELL
ncbi:4616_t:CDS:2 [Paraglomus brasilianum]|uniref:4616_t:CDS:1 n=1 Tax=Paraglomus brasilianum TaxID=144538 RepID=A0A9N9G487_9GLOM|nr:4616_t:CDS:2 [Paraglomus brasilianum]